MMVIIITPTVEVLVFVISVVAFVHFTEIVSGETEIMVTLDRDLVVVNGVAVLKMAVLRQVNINFVWRHDFIHVLSRR